MKGIGASAAGAVALGSDYGMVDDAEAIAPILVGGAIAGAAVVGWAVREYEVVGQNPPAEGLTAGALKQDLYETARTRKSTNASTFIDNQNIIDQLPNTLYSEGKLAAIEKLNEEAAKADVETAAHDAMNKYAATIEKNLLKSWNESVLELGNLISTVGSHSDVSQSDVFSTTSKDTYSFSTASISEEMHSTTLADGTEFAVHAPDVNHDYDMDTDPHWVDWSPVGGNSGYAMQVLSPNSGNVTYLSSDSWTGIWSTLRDTISSVESGLTTWVNNAYDQVQAGEIDVTELISPRERAEMIAAEDGAAQAIADLAALNIPIDSGNEYTITFPETGATLRGRLAVTDDSQSIESGTTYDPSADTFSGSAFFVYDVATGSGDWSAYEEGVDGGVATFTEEPYQKTQYEFTTSSNETVVANRSQFTPVNSSGGEVDPQDASAWEIDLSDKLENDITDLTEVDFFASTEESKIETINISSEFTVDKIVNAESDEEVDSASFESADAQTDDNYISKEEWEQLQQQNKELIEKYEESQSTGGGGIDLSQFDMFGLPGEIVALGGAGVALLIGKK